MQSVEDFLANGGTIKAVAAGKSGKAKKPMTVNAAYNIAYNAWDYPRHGEGFPIDSREKEAVRVLIANKNWRFTRDGEWDSASYPLKNFTP